MNMATLIGPRVGQSGYRMFPLIPFPDSQQLTYAYVGRSDMLAIVTHKVLIKKRSSYVGASLFPRFLTQYYGPQLIHRSGIRCRCSTKVAQAMDIRIRIRGHDRPVQRQTSVVALESS